MSYLIDDSVQVTADELKLVWQQNWELMIDDSRATNHIILAIEDTRKQIKGVLIKLN